MLIQDQTKRDTAQPETSIEASQKRGSKLKSRTQKDNHPLQLMIKQQINKKTKQDEENLLDHPLVRTLVSHKWSYFRFIYYLWAFLYLFFVLFLTCYISSTPAPFYERNQTLWQLEGLCVYEKEAELISPTTTWTFILRYSLFSFATILLIKECREFIIKLVGCWTSFKWKSLKEIQIDLIEILLYSTTILLTIPVPISKCSEWTGPINMWQRTSGILAVSFAWLNLALFSRKTKLFGIQIIAFTKVRPCLERIKFALIPLIQNYLCNDIINRLSLVFSIN